MSNEISELIVAADDVCATLEHPTNSVNAVQMWRLRDALKAISRAEQPVASDPSQFGSPELQALIVAKAMDKSSEPSSGERAELLMRCFEILRWHRTGVLTGNALREYAASKYGDNHNALQCAENDTAREAYAALLSSDAKPASEPVLSNAAKAGINCMSAWPFKTHQEASEPVVVPQGMKLIQNPITEDMHIAAVKVLQRANGIDGLPQRMLDAMLSTAPSPAPVGINGLTEAE